MHRPYYEQEIPSVAALAMAATKRALDPAWIMNPDVLLPIGYRTSIVKSRL